MGGIEGAREDGCGDRSVVPLWVVKSLYSLPARRYASAVLTVIVCLSVCPSVCLSQVCVLLRRLSLVSGKQRHTIAQ